MELFIAMARYARAVANEDIVAAFRLGALAVSAQRVVAELRAADGALEPLEIGQLEGKSLEMLLADAGSREIIRNIPLDLLIWHRFHGRWKPTWLLGSAVEWLAVVAAIDRFSG